MKIALPVLVSILFIIPLTAHAAFTCKGKRIGGFSKFDVLRYCGKPLMKDSYLKSGKLANGNTNTLNGRASANNIAWSEVQQWFYTDGYQKNSYTVEFEGGLVIRVIKGQKSP